MNISNRWRGRENALSAQNGSSKGAMGFLGGEICWNWGCEQASSTVVCGAVHPAAVQSTLLAPYEQGPALTAGSSKACPMHKGAHCLPILGHISAKGHHGFSLKPRPGLSQGELNIHCPNINSYNSAVSPVHHKITTSTMSSWAEIEPKLTGWKSLIALTPICMLHWQFTPGPSAAPCEY